MTFINSLLGFISADFLKYVLPAALAIGGTYMDIKSDLRSLKEGQVASVALQNERDKTQGIKDSIQDDKIDRIGTTINDATKELRSDIKELRKEIAEKRR